MNTRMKAGSCHHLWGVGGRSRRPRTSGEGFERSLRRGVGKTPAKRGFLADRLDRSIAQEAWVATEVATRREESQRRRRLRRQPSRRGRCLIELPLTYL